VNKKLLAVIGGVLALLLILALVLLRSRSAGPALSFRAYSLREAQRLTGRHAGGRDLTRLGGITALAGMVYDASGRDIILVGRANAGQPAITLDDLVVGLRAVLVRDEFPLVSIDRTPETGRTGKQTILFKGDISDTQFGKDLLEADIALKKLALELLPSGVPQVRSYFTDFLDKAARGDAAGLIGSRFWFYIAGDPSFAAVDGVFIIRQMRIGVKTEVMYASVKGLPVSDPGRVQDASADEFSGQVTEHYFDLCRTYPQVGRVKTLLDVVSLGKGVQTFPPDPELIRWLREYEVTAVATPREYDLLRRQEAVPGSNGMEVELNGGVELRARVLRLKAGDTSALRDAVLASRPKPDSLTWGVPLEGWEIPDALPVPATQTPAARRTGGSNSATPACSIEAQVRRPGAPPLAHTGPLPAPAAAMPRFGIYPNLSSQGAEASRPVSPSMALPPAVPPVASPPPVPPVGGVSADVKINPEDFAPGREQRKR